MLVYYMGKSVFVVIVLHYVTISCCLTFFLYDKFLDLSFEK